MIINILDFVDPKDSCRKQTNQFQSAINACYNSGGGTIIIPAGVYTIGSIRLLSDITLHLNNGAVINGSTDLNDYTDFSQSTGIKYVNDQHFISLWHLPKYYFHALFAAYDCKNIHVESEPGAIINSNNLQDIHGEEGFRGPMGLLFSKVKDLTLSGYTFINSSNWSHVIESCSNVKIHDINIIGGHDGFNLHHSQNINISACKLNTGDDCFAGYDVNNLQVDSCTMNTSCNGCRLSGENITIKNCNLLGPGKHPHISTNTTNTHALLKYYSLKEDLGKDNYSELSFENMIINDIDRLLMYRYNSPQLLQDGIPLKKLSFKNLNINNLKKTSYCEGNGKKITLDFKNCVIGSSIPKIFMIIDDSVEIDFVNTFFEKEVFLQTVSGKVFSLKGQISTQI